MILIIKHIDIEGPGTLGEFFKEKSLKTKVVELSRADKLPSLNECEAIVSLGGPMNVYEEDKYPFLKEEDKLLKEAVRQEVPILGICLGAQLLAKACQAKVKKALQKEIGWKKVNLTKEGISDPLFENMPQVVTVFQWHEDTFELPSGSLHLAESKACPNQAFRSGRNAYGLQFHAEVTPEMIGSWMDKYAKKDCAEFNAQDMLIESQKRKELLRKQAGTIYSNFSRIIAASRKIRAG